MDQPSQMSPLIKWTLAALILAAALAIRLYHFDYPFIATQDSGMFPSFARGTAEVGLAKARFLPVSSYLTNPDRHFHHAAHPSLTHNLVGLAFQAFGYHESVYRAFNVVWGCLAGLFLFMLVSARISPLAGLFALGCWALLPSGAYFERMYSMSLQSLAMSLAMLHFFFQYADSGRKAHLFGLLACCVIGPLFDWNFSFMFPGLFLYCLITRKNLGRFFLAASVSGLTVVGYMAYSALVKTQHPYFQAGSKGSGYWLSYALTKLNPLKVLNWDYACRVARLFSLHFTWLGWLIPPAWLAALAWMRIRAEKAGPRLWLPLVLSGPALIYIWVVPSNTLGHIWTLIWFLAPLAAALGVVLEALASGKAGRPVRLAACVGVWAGLIFFSLPTLARLHQPSPYLVANTRAGQIISLFHDHDCYGLVQNHDTLAFYAGISLFDLPGGKPVGSVLADLEAKGRGLPCLAALNQAYQPLASAGGAKKGVDLARMDEELGRYGLKRWLNQPTLVWTARDVGGLYLFMDQYNPVRPGPGDKELARAAGWFVSGPALRRGLGWSLGNGRGQAVFRSIPAPPGKSVFKALAFAKPGPLAGSDWRVECKVEVIDGGVAVPVASASLSAAHPNAGVAAKLGGFAGKRVDFKFSWQAKGLKGPLSLYWVEPRIQGPGMKGRNLFGIAPGFRFWPEAGLRGNWQPMDPRAAAGYWAGLLGLR